MTKSLGTISDIAGGSLVGFPMLGELIDLQRNLEVFAAAAAGIALPPNGRLQFPKLTGGSTAYWVGESLAVTESPGHRQSRFAGEETRRAGQGKQRTLTLCQSFGRRIDSAGHGPDGGPEADLAMLEGTGGTQIKGLPSYSDIATLTAGDPGTNGDTFQAQDVPEISANCRMRSRRRRHG